MFLKEQLWLEVSPGEREEFLLEHTLCTGVNGNPIRDRVCPSVVRFSTGKRLQPSVKISGEAEAQGRPHSR